MVAVFLLPRLFFHSYYDNRLAGVFLLLSEVTQLNKVESDVLRSSLCSVKEQLLSATPVRLCGGVWLL